MFGASQIDDIEEDLGGHEDFDEEEDDEAGSDDDKGDANAPATNRPRYPFGRGPTNNFGDGMTGKVKRLRATPRTSPKYTSQIQFS